MRFHFEFHAPTAEYFMKISAMRRNNALRYFTQYEYLTKSASIM